MTIIIGFLLAMSASTADSGNIAATKTQDKDNDPVICQSFQETGSLLKKRRVCMHRSEWEAQRAQDKQAIDRSQIQRPLNGGGG